MNIKIIINPISGNKKFQRRARGIGDMLLQKGLAETVDYFQTTAKGDAYNAAKELRAEDWTLVVAVGGDGTINEVVHGLMDNRSGIPLAILPAGTSNDFAGFAKIPVHPRQFCQAVEAFTVKKIDVGRANNRYFINVFCGGKFMHIPHAVRQSIKARWGRMAYYFQALKDCKSGFSSSFRLTFSCDGKAPITEDVLFFTLTNSGQAGGYSGLAPEASLADGMLDLFVVRKANLPQFVARIIWYTLKKSNPPHMIYKQVKTLRISGEHCEDIPLDIDGELFEEKLPVDLCVCEQAISLLVRS